MPVWEFRCPNCETTVERWFVNHEASTHAKCETCFTPLERLLSVTAFIVKGYNAKNNYSRKS